MARALKPQPCSGSNGAKEPTMAAPAVLATPPVMPILTQFTDQVADCRTPGAVLDRLNDLVSHYLPMSVLGAAHIPLKLSDWRSIRLGEDVFLNSSAPEGGGTSTPLCPAP